MTSKVHEPSEHRAHDMYASDDAARSEFVNRYRALFPKAALYFHYKGGIYEVRDYVEDTEDGVVRVIYRHLWPHATHEWKSRPAESFNDAVTTPEDGDWVYRFSRYY